MIALDEGANLPPIIYYHRVAPNADPDTGVTPDSFDRQMGILKRLGFQGVAMRDLWESGNGGKSGFICITFDDGYQDNYEWAAPILEKYGFRATIYCVTGKMGKKTAWAKDPRWVGHLLMRPEDARDLSRRGFEIAGHSRTHPDLSSLTGEDLWREIYGCREDLQEILGEKVNNFCYPYGFYNEETKETVRRAGYMTARSTRRMRPGRIENRYDLPARSISGEMSLGRFALTVTGFRVVEKSRKPVSLVDNDRKHSADKF